MNLHGILCIMITAIMLFMQCDVPNTKRIEMYSDLPELKFLYKYFIKVKLDNVIHITNFRIISFTNIIVSCKSLHCKQFFFT